ncbi:2-amino-4-oxopentanoate thiolase subunit OrtB [Aminiphilus sp.]|uniref:2-amino-4-oxopentanoate thiolase subunit OrtB n=1 Tax=Aminiphilus sp. TaxID=1872488 RepID=UPI002623209F|nr:2-amino-4-oxopentanoate thiolase subunit OrtB [Aminiphilus sp.]
MTGDYGAVMARRGEIMRKSVGIDYERFSRGRLAFDYEGMMCETGYSLDEVEAIQRESNVGNTPLLELKNLTRLVRTLSEPGKGARLFVKDEANNPARSFKDRRASLSVFHAEHNGYKGVVAATSGNYGAAVASQAARKNLGCIIVQEVFDSKGFEQPEIAEKGRACEAYGAEVLQLSVGPELFYVFLLVLEETAFFNASLYTPFSIAGIETLGTEIAEQTRRLTGRDPDVVVSTHAGGGITTGTARGLLKAGCSATRIVGASVNLQGLHMASDRDFNRKSFTTGHTGFGIPFAVWPDRSDVPRNAARVLRYLDDYVTVTQGAVFYMTEALAQLEGLERGPAGNTSLTAAFALAQTLPEEAVVVVNETEYTGAGKHPYAQLAFAERMGVEVRRGDPEEERPGSVIVIPEQPRQIRVAPVDLNRLRASYVRNACAALGEDKTVSEEDVAFLSEDTRLSSEEVRRVLRENGVSVATA